MNQQSEDKLEGEGEVPITSKALFSEEVPLSKMPEQVKETIKRNSQSR